MEYPTFYQILLDSNKALSFDATTRRAEFVIKPDPRAPIIDEDWRGGGHAAYLVNIQGAAGKSILGVTSPNFRGAENNLDEHAVLFSEFCSGGAVATTYTCVNDHNYMNLTDPYLFRNGGRLSLSLVHLDRAAGDDSYTVPTAVAKFVVILRFEKVRGLEKKKCSCHGK